MAVIYSKAKKPARASVTVKETKKAAGKPPAGKKEKKDEK